MALANFTALRGHWTWNNSIVLWRIPSWLPQGPIFRSWFHYFPARQWSQMHVPLHEGPVSDVIHQYSSIGAIPSQSKDYLAYLRGSQLPTMPSSSPSEQPLWLVDCFEGKMGVLRYRHHVQVVWEFAASHWGTQAGQAITYQVIIFFVFYSYCFWCMLVSVLRLSTLRVQGVRGQQS